MRYHFMAQLYADIRRKRSVLLHLAIPYGAAPYYPAVKLGGTPHHTYSDYRSAEGISRLT